MGLVVGGEREGEEGAQIQQGDDAAARRSKLVLPLCSPRHIQEEGSGDCSTPRVSPSIRSRERAWQRGGDRIDNDFSDRCIF